MSNNGERISSIEHYLEIADTVSKRGTCRRRRYGSIIVVNDEIISTGYVGAPRGRKNCIDMDECIREKLNIPVGQRYELCRSVHSEANAIISAARRDMIGGTLYLSGRQVKTNELVEAGEPCSMCKRLIINAGITTVVVNDPNGIKIFEVKNWIEKDDTIPSEGY